MSVNPVIILVQPQLGENIGMCARAMLNCGFTELRLVAPRDGWPSDTARSASSGAVDVIDRARIYTNLAEAIADCRFVIASTARPREMTKPVLEPAQAIETMRAHHNATFPCGIVFGPERAGLVNDDVALCDAIVNIPLNPAYSSLNLAQAVLLLCYEWRRADCSMPPLDGIVVDHRATKKEHEALHTSLVQMLERKNFFKDDRMRPTLLRSLRTALQKSQLTSREVQGLHGIIKTLYSGQ